MSCRYLAVAGGLWTSLAGPWSGLQAAAATEEEHMLPNAVSTMIFFLASFCFTLKPESRWESQCTLIWHSKLTLLFPKSLYNNAFLVTFSSSLLFCLCFSAHICVIFFFLSLLFAAI